MVFRGLPSPGCESCRKDKKRCTLERPACARCKRTRRTCRGYRDTTALRIQDESSNVKKRLQTRPSRDLSQDDSCFVLWQSKVYHDLPITNSPISSASTVLLCQPNPDLRDAFAHCFFAAFAGRKHWNYIATVFQQAQPSSALSQAIQACGLAKIAVEHCSRDEDRQARSMYCSALTKLNKDLGDTRRATTEASLFAVIVLGYFEILTSEGPSFNTSWAAHVHGACRIIQLRGIEQLQTENGRAVFRELRLQHLICSQLDESDPPEFLRGWQDSLALLTAGCEHELTADRLVMLCMEANTHMNRDYRDQRAQRAAWWDSLELERRLDKWAHETQAERGPYSFSETIVPDSLDLWKDTTHIYAPKESSMAHPPVGVWQLYRSIRILLSNHQERLCMKLGETRHLDRLTSVRRQMSEQICYSASYGVDHAIDAPADSPPVLLVDRQIWPLFLAADACLKLTQEAQTPSRYVDEAHRTQAVAQLAWIEGRLVRVANAMGFRWIRTLNLPPLRKSIWNFVNGDIRSKMRSG